MNLRPWWWSRQCGLSSRQCLVQRLSGRCVRSGLTVSGGLGDLGLTDVLLLGDGLCDGREVRIRGPVGLGGQRFDPEKQDQTEGKED